MLTECAGVHAFARLAEGSLSRWRIEATREPIGLWARSADGALVLFVSGRQIMTAEGLEVLALGAHDVFPDGRGVDPIFADVVTAGALAVLPWGFGKWSGRRGAIVKRLAKDQDSLRYLFFGDYGGRPWLFARPRLLGFAERCGRLVLPGSDPPARLILVERPLKRAHEHVGLVVTLMPEDPMRAWAGGSGS